MNLWPGLLLGIESSCDETSAAILDGSQVRSLVIASQVEMHRRWGGVVPEAAARAHVEAILPTILDALSQAGAAPEQITAVAVTNRPGLVGALSVGVSAAKAWAWYRSVPLIGVHHLEGHVVSPYLDGGDPPTPHLCLIVSGGHTELVAVDGPGRYRLIGQTLDDAAGEAFDKSARLLGLGIPGGYAIQQAAAGGNPRAVPLPRGLAKDPMNFSFSGLKTAVMRQVELAGESLDVADMAASVQEAIVDSLTAKAIAALEETGSRCLTLVGGVAANLCLRQRLENECRKRGIEFHPAPLRYCTDNAAMIALAGSVRLQRCERDGFQLDAEANAPLPGAMIES